MSASDLAFGISAKETLARSGARDERAIAERDKRIAALELAGQVASETPEQAAVAYNVLLNRINGIEALANVQKRILFRKQGTVDRLPRALGRRRVGPATAIMSGRGNLLPGEPFGQLSLGDDRSRWNAYLETIQGRTATFRQVNEVRMADQFAGSDISAKINAAIDSITTKGIIDARGMTSGLTITESITDDGKDITILLPPATVTATVHPALRLNGAGKLTVIGMGEDRTQITAASATGSVVSKEAAGDFWMESLTINGNSTVDNGVHIDAGAGAFQDYGMSRVKVTGFNKATTGAALKITGANAGKFYDCKFNASTIGVHLTTRTTGIGSANLNRFYGGQMGSNARHLLMDNAGASDSPSGNVFNGVEFVNASAAASVFVRRGLSNWFNNCWFESNVAGTQLIRIGDSAVANDNPRATVFFACNFTEENDIDYLIQGQRGQGTSILFCRDSQTAPGGTTNYLGRQETNHTEMCLWGNSNPSPPTGWPLSDASGAVDGWDMGPNTRIRKTAVGFALSIPVTGITSTALVLRSPQASTDITQFQDSSGAQKARIEDDGDFKFDGATGMLDATGANVLTLAGRSSGTNGANIELYGGSHATNPNDAFYDADDHQFRNQAGTTAYLTVVTGGATPGVRVDNDVGFYGGAPAAKQNITGSRGGNVALANLLIGLAAIGLITDSTT